MRALEPAESGQLTVAGYRIGYEVFGDAAAPAVLLLPGWQILHSRLWKFQVPFLARSFRVITYDAAGNGGGERTEDPAAFEYDRIGDQAIGLLDHLGVARASVVGLSRGCEYGVSLAARYPERVDRLVLIGNGVSSSWRPPAGPEFWERRAEYEGWQKLNGHYLREHYPDFVGFFFDQLFPEPHSSKAIDDSIGWAMETTPEILVRTIPNPDLLPRMPAGEAIACINCPVLIVHGSEDRRTPIEGSRDLAAARPDWRFVIFEGSGHAIPIREPVRANLLLRDFLTDPSFG